MHASVFVELFLTALVVVILVNSKSGEGIPKFVMRRTVQNYFQATKPSPNSIYGREDSVKNNLIEYEIPNNYCSPLPKISILSYTREDFLPNATVTTELVLLDTDKVTDDGRGQIWIAPFAATIELGCEARVPIEWAFDGPHEPEILSIDVSRASVTSSNSRSKHSGNCFRIVAKLLTGKRSTGKYRCRAIGESQVQANQSQNTWLYLYGEANGPPFLLYQGREFTVVQNESSPTVILPCQVVNPFVVPELFKGVSQVLTLQGSPFEAQVGFILNLRNIPSPFDSYKCSREGGAVRVNVKRLPEFRVTPQSVHLTVVEGNFIRLVCEATYPIGLQGFIDDTKVTIIEDANAPVYKYKLTYDYHSIRKESDIGISCVNLQTNATLHTWHSIEISPETDKEAGIRYDPETQRFYCVSKTGNPPTIALAKCNSIMECQLMDRCFTWDAPYKIVGGNSCFSETRKPNRIQRGITCPNREDKPFNSSQGCAYVKNTYSAGTVHCSLPDNGENVKAYFFNGLQSGAGVVIFDWQQAPAAELIDIDVLEQNRTFYTHELIEFECTIPKFIFARGQIFKFKLDDGSLVAPNNETLRFNGNADDDSLIIKTSRLELHDPRIKEVVCIAPFWNQTGWMSSSVPINVAASIPPRFITQSEFVDSIHFIAGGNTSVTCEAEGLPLPKVAWYKNGKRFDNQKEKTQLNGKSKISTMYFDYVNPSDEGEYVCELSNVAGKESKAVSLVVTQNRRTVYTALIIGLVTILIFLTILTILYRKLRKNQAIVRRLTEKEVKFFEKGDTEALRSVPDGYIRAQFLPYDKEYEIKQENLEIDDEDILGKGEYGIVKKGTLRLKDSLKEVAVKTSRSPDVNHFKALLTELKMLTYIGWHDNVINLLGAVTRNLRDRDVYVVVEYCRLGDLESYLRHNRSCFLNQIVDEKIDLNRNFSFNPMQPYQPAEYTMKTADLISWSYQISSGMEYLANKKVIHGDLATRNILLTEDRTVKITDFGLSKHLYNGSNYISHAIVNLPWKHCSPEILQFNSFSTQSDVWAAGVTFWEIFSLGDIPYPGTMWSWDFKTQLLQGYRMAKPEFANQDTYNQILKCWKNTPAERISFPELRKYFHRLLHHWAEEDSSGETTPSPTQVTPDHLQENLLGNHYVASPTNQHRVHYTATAIMA